MCISCCGSDVAMRTATTLCADSYVVVDGHAVNKQRAVRTCVCVLAVQSLRCGQIPALVDALRRV